MSGTCTTPLECAGGDHLPGCPYRTTESALDDMSPEARLNITRRVLTETLRYLADTNNTLSDNLTATQDRCTELLEHSRSLSKENARLKKVLEACAKQVQSELDGGYVLSYEPMAGAMWRGRWNELLGRVEQALGRKEPT